MLPWYAVGWDSSVSLAICAHQKLMIYMQTWMSCIQSWFFYMQGHSVTAAYHANLLTFPLTVVSCNRLFSLEILYSHRNLSKGSWRKCLHSRQIKGSDWSSRRLWRSDKRQNHVGLPQGFHFCSGKYWLCFESHALLWFGLQQQANILLILETLDTRSKLRLSRVFSF